ncbi:MAG: acetyl-coenzyme A transporter 1-domain-containing protein [Piptocephalis tieghemiana]|nr:MAG: acetyl-coenzyme A transporter 1-domain-containing protein [Piptocephalis tieghemiana]
MTTVGQYAAAFGLRTNILHPPPLPTQSIHPKLSIYTVLSQNILLLILLYTLQGVPVGLTFGSLPFLLKENMSYAQLGVFSLATYPYSLKLFWSPIVDAIYSQGFGRRKTWIVPIQFIVGLVFLWLGYSIDDMMSSLDASTSVIAFTGIFFGLILLCATQDIAVDGWALTLLSQENLSYASTAQTIGLNTGYFVSFTIFLALNSAEFCNKYLRWDGTEGTEGLFSLGGYMTFWGYVYLVVTGILVFFKSEGKESEDDSDSLNVRESYQTMVDLLKLPHLRSFVIVLLISKIGFIANESVTGLKLLELGFSREDLALTVLIDFPIQLLFGYLAAKWSTGDRPLRPWSLAFLGRLVFSAVGMLMIQWYPRGAPMSTSYYMFVIVSTVISSFMSTVQFVSISAFMTSIADPLIGGTYMTFLNTLSNFGGTWPRFFILEAVDKFTVTQCVHPAGESLEGAALPQTCSTDADKNACMAGNGTCETLQDGYYWVSSMTIALGAALYLVYIQRQINRLQGIPPAMWKLEASRVKKTE